MGCLHLMGLFSCQDNDEEGTVKIYNRETQPILKSVGVSTLISDSGIRPAYIIQYALYCSNTKQ